MWDLTVVVVGGRLPLFASAPVFGSLSPLVPGLLPWASGWFDGEVDGDGMLLCFDEFVSKGHALLDGRGCCLEPCFLVGQCVSQEILLGCVQPCLVFRCQLVGH